MSERYILVEVAEPISDPEKASKLAALGIEVAPAIAMDTELYLKNFPNLKNKLTPESAAQAVMLVSTGETEGEYRRVARDHLNACLLVYEPPSGFPVIGDPDIDEAKRPDVIERIFHDCSFVTALELQIDQDEP